VRAILERELGGPVDRLFASFEMEPFASASIGQVHRATLFDGRSVAVKVQHAHIEEAIESDLKNAGMVEALVAALGPKVMNTHAVFAEVKQRFREELDYTLEAERQRYFAKVHAGDPKIRVPRVIGERCARRVLTSELVHGKALDDLKGAPEALRRGYAETMWRFVFKGNLVGGMFNADPHPGNYIFHEDGRITFLDFGCVQPIDPVQLKRSRRVHQAALRGDRAAFERRVSELLGLVGGRFEAAALEYLHLCFQPLFASPFHITRAYVSEVVSEIQELKKHMFAKDKSFVPLPANMVFMNRLQFGFYSVLARLDVSADYASVERSFLESQGSPSPRQLAEG
jgi:predicted unusual protein kinase regulating ubiquinone biosynthesis (AarF/ABC1/UbiB family)